MKLTYEMIINPYLVLVYIKNEGWTLIPDYWTMDSFPESIIY